MVSSYDIEQNVPTSSAQEVEGGPSDRRIPRMGQNLPDYMKYFFFDSFFPSLQQNVLFGINVYPVGGLTTKATISFFLSIMCMADFILLCFIYPQVASLTGNANRILDPSPEAVLWLLIWPLAVVISPILGFASSAIVGDVMLARVYSSWLKLSFINTSILIGLGYQSLSSNKDSTWESVTVYVWSQFASKVVQWLLCDLYVAHLENARWTRGWDGLSTSLYSSRDHDIDLNIK